MQLSLINKLGFECLHYFKDANGSEVFESKPESDYDAVLSGTQPTKEGCTWAYSVRAEKYDTSSGRLEDGQYVPMSGSNDYVLVKLTNCAPAQVLASFIDVNGVLDDRVVDDIRLKNGV